MTRASCLPLKKGTFTFSTNHVFTLLENDKSDSRVNLRHLGEKILEPSLARGQSVGKERVGTFFLFFFCRILMSCMTLNVWLRKLTEYKAATHSNFNHEKKRLTGELHVDEIFRILEFQHAFH